MRLILAVVFLVLYLTVFSLPVWPVLWLIRKKNPARADRMALSYVQGAFRVLGWLCGVHLTVTGRENIPEDRPVLYVSNHRSYFDIVIGYPLVKGLCGFVAKKQILKVPLLRVWMRLLYCQFLDRDNVREGMKTIKSCVEQIRDNGISMWICPEGTRNQEAEMLPFKEGSFKIAEMAGCPVVPVAIRHSDDVLEKHVPWIHSAHVTIAFGKPVETADLDRAGKKALPGQVRGIIEEMLKENV